jgi:U2 small nuclear ribonucleoprotein B''
MTWFCIRAHPSTQQIAYAKGQSQIIPKLRGTFEPPTAGTGAVETTELQRSIFNAPPSSIPTKPVETNGVRPAEASLPNPPHGVKRSREEEEEEEEEEKEEEEEEKDKKKADEDDADDAPMEEDEESDAPMEASSDED